MQISECVVEYALAPRENQAPAFTNRIQNARVALLWNGVKKLCLAVIASGAGSISMHLLEDNTVSVEDPQTVLPLRFRVFCEFQEAQRMSVILKGLRDRVPVDKLPGVELARLAVSPEVDLKAAPLLRRAVHPTGAPPPYPGTGHAALKSSVGGGGPAVSAAPPLPAYAFAAAAPQPAAGPGSPKNPPPSFFSASSASAPFPPAAAAPQHDPSQNEEEAAQRESRLEHEILELQSILDQSQERLTAEERDKATAIAALRKSEEDKAKTDEEKRALEDRLRHLLDETSRLSSDLAAMRLKGGSNGADRAPRPASDIYTYLMELDPSSLLVDDKQRLGEGSFGIVYRAVYNATPVAVKKLRIGLIEQKRDEFEAELMTLMLLRHPNIVLMITACFSGKWRGQECIVCELMEGGNLYDLLHIRKISLSSAQKRSVMVGIGRGLAYLHGLRPQLIHRDLTPANILLDASFTVPKLSDFGLSRWRAEMSVAKTQAGTLRWMAPEIFREEGYEASADVYSFGLVLWEIFTGILPFAEISEAALPIQVGVKHMRPKGDSLPDRFRSLVERCWSDDPKRRPSAVEATRELESGAADPVRPPPAPTPSVV